MCSKFCLGEHGHIIFPNTGTVFNSRMKPFCGQAGTITEVIEGARKEVSVRFDNPHIDTNNWTFVQPMFTSLYGKIVITSDGKTTAAQLYRDEELIKTATAKCSPDDTYNFEFGTRLAMDRLMESIIEVGDTVEVTDWEQIYPTYDEWLLTNASTYSVYYSYGALPTAYDKQPHKKYTVFAKAKHSSDNTMLYLISEGTIDSPYYLMDESGVKRINVLKQ